MCLAVIHGWVGLKGLWGSISACTRPTVHDPNWEPGWAPPNKHRNTTQHGAGQAAHQLLWEVHDSCPGTMWSATTKFSFQNIPNLVGNTTLNLFNPNNQQEGATKIKAKKRLSFLNYFAKTWVLGVEALAFASLRWSEAAVPRPPQSSKGETL